MTESQEAPIEQRRLRTAEDLLLALRSPDLQTRAAVLASIMQAPDKALAFGSYQGVDLIDELIDQCFRSDVPLYRHLVAAALSVLDDPRVPPAMRRLLNFYGEPDLVRVAADRLSREPVEDGIAHYRALAMQTDSALHTQIGADLLLNANGLDPRLAIRVSVANGRNQSIAPDLTSDNVDAWLAELNGPYLRGATLLIELQGLNAFRLLVDNWSRVNVETQEWIVRWGSREFPLDAVTVLRAAIQSEHDSVALEGLRGIESLGPAQSLFSAELSPLISHSNPHVRALAISAGATINDAGEALKRELEPVVIAELLILLRRQEGEASIEYLVGALTHSDYRVRVQAMTELTALGECVRERAQQMVLSDSMDHRVAGTNLLLAMGHQEWLEQHLLG